MQRTDCYRAEYRILDNNRGLQPQQELVRRYMAPHEKHKFLLAMHNPGWGKTYALAAIAHDYYTVGKEVVVLTVGPDGKTNFRMQLEKYISANSLDPMPARANHLVQYRNYRAFANEIGRIADDESLRRAYDRRLFMLDEVHNVKADSLSGEDEQTSTKLALNPILRLTKVCKEAKFLCATATPIVNSADEMCYILGMFEGTSGIQVDTTRRVALSDVSNLRGYVSFSEDRTCEVDSPCAKLIYEGVPFCGVNIVPCLMHGAELEEYKNATAHARLSCMLSWERSVSLAFSNEQLYTMRGDTIVVSAENAAKLQRTELHNISAKYAKTLDIVRTSEGPVFIYCEFVAGNAIHLLRAVLQSNGYKFYNGESTVATPDGKMYTCIDGSSPDRSITVHKNRIEMYNRPENHDGSIIKILIGSNVAGQSISLMNTRTLIMLTAKWNASQERQVIGRVTRRDSHVNLRPEQRHVKVYRLVSITEENDIKYGNPLLADLVMLSTMQHKEAEMVPYVNAMQNCSIEGMLSAPVKESELDYSGLFTHYMDSVSESKANDVWNLVLRNFVCHISAFYSIFGGNTTVTKEAVLRLIEHNSSVMYYSGKRAYLRRYGDLIHAVSSPMSRADCQPDSTLMVVEYATRLTFEPRAQESVCPLVDDRGILSMTSRELVTLCRSHDTFYCRKLLRRAIELNAEDVVLAFEMCVHAMNGMIYTTIYAKSPLETPYNHQYVERVDRKLIMRYDMKEWIQLDQYENADEIQAVLDALVEKFEEFKRVHDKIYFFISVNDWKSRVALTESDNSARDPRYKHRGMGLLNYSPADLRWIYDTYLSSYPEARGIDVDRVSRSRRTLVSTIEEIAFEHGSMLIY